MQRNRKNGGGEAARRKQVNAIALPEVDKKPGEGPWTTTHANTEGLPDVKTWL